MIDRDIADDRLAIQDRVLVEAEFAGRPTSFRAVIVRVCPSELWLGLASPDRRLETMRPDQPIRLTVARNDAGLLGQSDFLRPLGGSKSRVFAVGRPAVLDRVQRRGYVRYPIDLPMQFRHIDPDTWQPCGKVATTVTKNLSPGGLLFVSDVQISVGDDLDLTLPLSLWDRVSMTGVVRRVAPGFSEDQALPAGQPQTNEAAVKFTRITALDQDRIVRLILLAEHRRREAAVARGQMPGMPIP